MNMKKLLVLILIVLTVFSCISCSSGKIDTKEELNDCPMKFYPPEETSQTVLKLKNIDYIFERIGLN